MYIDTHDRPTGHAIHRLAESLADRIKARRRRRKFRTLLDLDDVMLNDIGVTRGEVQIASSLPLSQDAGTELRRMSLERRQAWM